MKDTKVDGYIRKQKSPQKAICIRLREIVFKTFPDIKEEMKWGVPSYADGKYYFVALKTHVNLGFSIKGLSKEKIALFQGSGKTMRHLEIQSEKEIDEKRIVKLLKLIQEEIGKELFEDNAGLNVSEQTMKSNDTKNSSSPKRKINKASKENGNVKKKLRSEKILALEAQKLTEVGLLKRTNQECRHTQENLNSAKKLRR